MATLTYDSNEQVEGELTAEEQDSLKVGEALEKQQESLLAGKYKNAEALEKMLKKKLQMKSRKNLTDSLISYG